MISQTDRQNQGNAGIFLPAFYPNELLYSWILRLANLASLKKIHTAQFLFSCDEFPFSLRFPQKLHWLKVNGVFSQEELLGIIDKHTLLNFYLLFIEPHRRTKIEKLIFSNEKVHDSVENRLGLNRGPTRQLSIPKYCPECNNKQTRAREEIYWNRIHQIPGINVCYLHGCNLENCVLPRSASIEKYPKYRPSVDCCPVKTAKPCNGSLSLLIAERCAEIVNNQKHVDLGYSEICKSHGHLNGSQLNHNEIGDEYNRFSQTLGNNFEYSRLIFQKYKITNPARHIVFQLFLENGMSQKSTTSKHEYWDKALLESVHPRCPSCKANYNRISHLSYHYDNKAKRTIGRFACHCGCLFTLSCLIANGKVSQVNTRRYRYDRKNSYKPSNSLPNRLAERRTKWDKLMRKGKLTHKEKNEKYALLKWFKRHDATWLGEALKMKNPNTKSTTIKAKIEKQVSLVVAAAIALKDEQLKARISVAKILKRAGINSGKDVSREVLNAAKDQSESLKEFQERRLMYTAEKMRSEGKNITPNGLLLEAHAWRFRNTLIKKATEICQTLNSSF